MTPVSDLLSLADELSKHEHNRNYLGLWIPPAGVLAIINLTSMQTILQIALIAVTISYQLWRWRRETLRTRAQARLHHRILLKK